MADRNHSPGYPFAGSFFSPSKPQQTRLPTIAGNGAFKAHAVSLEYPSHASIVLHLNGQMETFCAHTECVLIRPCSNPEKARVLMFYFELEALLSRMDSAIKAACLHQG